MKNLKMTLLAVALMVSGAALAATYNGGDDSNVPSSVNNPTNIVQGAAAPGIGAGGMVTAADLLAAVKGHTAMGGLIAIDANGGLSYSGVFQCTLGNSTSSTTTFMGLGKGVAACKTTANTYSSASAIVYQAQPGGISVTEYTSACSTCTGYTIGATKVYGWD